MGFMFVLGYAGFKVLFPKIKRNFLNPFFNLKIYYSYKTLVT